MKDFLVSNRLFTYDLLEILAILAISLKENIIFAKFIEELLDNNVTSARTHVADKPKIILKLFEFTFSDFLLNALCHQNFFKNML